MGIVIDKEKYNPFGDYEIKNAADTTRILTATPKGAIDRERSTLTSAQGVANLAADQALTNVMVDSAAVAASSPSEQTSLGQIAQAISLYLH